MSISSNYDYYSQINSTQIWQQMFQTGSSKDKSTAQDLVQTVGSTTQDSASQKSSSPLAELVSDGTITSEQDQAIKEALEAARMAYSTQAGAQNASSNTAFSDPLSSLVSSGTITEDQKDAVSSALQSGMTSGMQGMQPPPPPPTSSEEDSEEDGVTSVLDSLVTDGTLTEDQETSILSALQSAFESSASETETETDTDETDPLASLVSAGTITDEQKEAVKSALDSAMNAQGQQGMPPPPPPMSGEDLESDGVTSILDSLVTDGTLTEDQETSVLTALTSAFQSNTTSDSETDTSTSEETNTLDSLVAAGTITEDQKNAIGSAFEEAMSSQMMPPPPPMAQDTSADALTSALDELVEAGTITEEQQQSISSLFQSAINAYSAQSASGYDLLTSSYETNV